MGKMLYKCLLVWAVVISFPINSSACNCTMTSIEHHIKTTKYIAVVKIVRLYDTFNHLVPYMYRHNESYQVGVTLDSVYKWKKRKIPKHIDLTSEFSSCDIRFKKGEKYLLFLVKTKHGYHIRYCSYSTELYNASVALNAIHTALDSKKKKKPTKNKKKKITSLAYYKKIEPVRIRTLLILPLYSSNIIFSL